VIGDVWVRDTIPGFAPQWRYITSNSDTRVFARRHSVRLSMTSGFTKSTIIAFSWFQPLLDPDVAPERRDQFPRSNAQSLESSCLIFTPTSIPAKFLPAPPINIDTCHPLPNFVAELVTGEISDCASDLKFRNSKPGRGFRLNCAYGLVGFPPVPVPIKVKQPDINFWSESFSRLHSRPSMSTFGSNARQ
jgi:hypothetical protein